MVADDTGSVLCAAEVIMPMLTRPDTLPPSWAISSRMRSMSDRIGATRCARASPAEVSDMPREAR